LVPERKSNLNLFEEFEEAKEVKEAKNRKRVTIEQ